MIKYIGDSLRLVASVSKAPLLLGLGLMGVVLFVSLLVSVLMQVNSFVADGLVTHVNAMTAVGERSGVRKDDHLVVSYEGKDGITTASVTPVIQPTEYKAGDAIRLRISRNIVREDRAEVIVIPLTASGVFALLLMNYALIRKVEWKEEDVINSPENFKKALTGIAVILITFALLGGLIEAAISFFQ